MKLAHLLTLALLLAGCADSPSVPSDEAPAINDAAEQTDETEPGQPGSPGSPGEPSRPDMQPEVVFEDFILATWEGGNQSIVIPDDAERVWLEVDYHDGAYQDAGFTLGACDHVSPSTGIGVSVNGMLIGVAGNTSRNVQYPCGELHGEHDLSWQLAAGFVRAFVRVIADVPEA